MGSPIDMHMPLWGRALEKLKKRKRPLFSLLTCERRFGEGGGVGKGDQLVVLFYLLQPSNHIILKSIYVSLSEVTWYPLFYDM